MSTRLLLRLAAPLLAASLLLLAVAAATAWYVQRLHADVSEILASNVASMRAAEELEIGLCEIRNRLDRFLLTGDRAHLDAVPPLRREADHWLAEAERLGDTEREQALVARIKKAYPAFFADLDRFAAAREGPERGEILCLLDRVLTDEMLRPAHEYLDSNEELAAETADRNRLIAERMVFVLLLLGTCGLAAGGLAGFGLARSVSRSIVALSVPVRDAAGRLSEVAGPVLLPVGGGLEELETALGQLAEQVGAVVERLQQSQREGLRAEQLAALGQMAAGFAHEVRNPLMSMKILVQAAAERPGGGGLSGRHLSVLEEEIARLEGLTATFLEFARPPRPEKRTFDARALLEDAAGLLSWRAGQRDVRIDCDLPDGPVWLEADQGQLRQVVLNLLINALEAVPDGGEVRAGLEAAGGWVEVVVADTGRGLPADIGEDIFAPFVSTKPAGLGLGLSICKRVVEAHGGEIAAGDAPGGGAVFRVRLPAGFAQVGAPDLTVAEPA